jgi:uncharacterized protein YjbJ (UPF0337 family)
MDSSARDKTEGAWDKAKGNVKETVGKATDNRDLEAEGRGDKIKGGLEEAKGKVKDAADRAKDAVKDAVD